MIVIVDTNENSTAPASVEALRKHFSKVIVSKKQLGYDLKITLDDSSLLAIERKSPSDFLASIGDGRLKQQIETMHSQAAFSAVIVTGKINYSGNGFVRIEGKEEDRKWKAASVRGMIRAIQLSGTVLEWCPVSYYAQMVEEIYTTCNSEDHRQGLQKHRTVTFPPLDDRIQYLGQLPDFGIESATSLLKFAAAMDGDGDEDHLGTLAGAFHHLSIMSMYGQDARPKLFTGKRGANRILNTRKLFGLKSNEYLKIETENNDLQKDALEEQNGK